MEMKMLLSSRLLLPFLLVLQMAPVLRYVLIFIITNLIYIYRNILRVHFVTFVCVCLCIILLFDQILIHSKLVILYEILSSN